MRLRDTADTTRAHTHMRAITGGPRATSGSWSGAARTDEGFRERGWLGAWVHGWLVTWVAVGRRRRGVVPQHPLARSAAACPIAAAGRRRRTTRTLPLQKLALITLARAQSEPRRQLDGAAAGTLAHGCLGCRPQAERANEHCRMQQQHPGRVRCLVTQSRAVSELAEGGRSATATAKGTAARSK